MLLTQNALSNLENLFKALQGMLIVAHGLISYTYLKLGSYCIHVLITKHLLPEHESLLVRS